MLKTVIHFQLEKIKTNLLTFLLVVATALIVIYIGYRHDTLKQSLAYLLVMWLCSFFIDLYAIKKASTVGFVVRNPKRETYYFLVCFLLGLLFFYFRFSPSVDWQHLSGIKRLAVLPLIIFAFPIALAIILLILKYKPSDLGLRMRAFILIIPIILISALANRLVSPQSLTWDAVLAESGGVFGTLFSGIILAGLSEEFFRVVGQTRIGAYFNNFGIGWFVTTLLWALMHFPKWYSEDLNIAEGILSSIRIIPIGLMWGYMTHRTKSFVPSVIVHGLNFWGLQNF